MGRWAQIFAIHEPEASQQGPTAQSVIAWGPCGPVVACNLSCFPDLWRWFVYCFSKSSFSPSADIIWNQGMILGPNLHRHIISHCQALFINNSEPPMTAAAHREKSSVVNIRDAWHLSAATLAAHHAARAVRAWEACPSVTCGIRWVWKMFVTSWHIRHWWVFTTRAGMFSCIPKQQEQTWSSHMVKVKSMRKFRLCRHIYNRAENVQPKIALNKILW